MATYIYQLSDGTEGILPNLFVEKSKVISDMLVALESQENKIPLVNENMTKERLEKICDMLHFLNMEDKIKRGEKKRLQTVMDDAMKKEDGNLRELAIILNIVDFYDIDDEDESKSLWKYLINFFAEIIRTSKSPEDLKEMFGEVQSTAESLQE